MRIFLQPLKSKKDKDSDYRLLCIWNPYRFITSEA